MNWPKIMKLLRNRLLLSQTEMAEMLGISFASVNRYENGRHEPTIKIKRKVKELCQANGIDLTKYLLDEEDE